MRILCKIIMVFVLLVSSAYAAQTNLLVLPADLLNTRDNYYNFDEVSEIVSDDLIIAFNKTGKIISPDLYNVRERLSANPSVKTNLQSALEKYKNNGSVNYSVIKTAANYFGVRYVLLISSSAVTNKNSLKRSVWEVMELVSECNIVYPYRLETSLLLIDTSDNSIIWSNNYSTKLGANDNVFAAKNYAQANGEYEKIKLYSNRIVAPSASQNIVLRFYPKSVSPIETQVKDTGGALRYDKKLPEKPQIRVSEPNINDLMYDF